MNPPSQPAVPRCTRCDHATEAAGTCKMCGGNVRRVFTVPSREEAMDLDALAHDVVDTVQLFTARPLDPRCVPAVSATLRARIIAMQDHVDAMGDDAVGPTRPRSLLGINRDMMALLKEAHDMGAKHGREAFCDAPAPATPEPTERERLAKMCDEQAQVSADARMGAMDFRDWESAEVHLSEANDWRAIATILRRTPAPAAGMTPLEAQVHEAIAILENGSAYDRMHVVAILRNGLPPAPSAAPERETNDG